MSARVNLASVAGFLRSDASEAGLNQNENKKRERKRVKEWRDVVRRMASAITDSQDKG